MTQKSTFKLLIIFFLFSSLYSNSQTILTHNICNDVIKTINHACSDENAYFGRAFVLNDFGINNTEEFTITHGEVALTYAVSGARLRFNIYSIDTDFPNSFDENNLIGQSQIVNLPNIWSQGTQVAHIITVAFENPIVIPANVERILVSVKQEVPNWGSGLIHLAGTLEDNDFSYYKNCIAGPNYINTDDLDNNYIYPGSDYNFYIKAIEDFSNINAPLRIYQENDCYGLTKSFNLTSTVTNSITNINWDFGDPTSGANNNSTQINPSHIYSSEGIYTVTATITTATNESYIITNTITATQEDSQPIIVDDIFACEDTFGSGISSSFDTSSIENQVLNGQTGMIISYFDQNGNELPSPLPNPFTNTQENSQEITIRIKDSNRPCCFYETTFNAITTSLPDTNQTSDIISCDSNEDGFTTFDISDVPIELVDGQSNFTVELFDSHNNLIPTENYNDFANLTANQDYIKAVVTSQTTYCSSETNINLIVNDNPVVNQLQPIYGCDENNDGISEYFDTSNIENQVLNGQTGMTFSYFDQNGNELDSPLPNPYTNSNPFSEIITIRVTDNNYGCSTETTLQLQTVTQPNINQPDNIYACDQGNGYAKFDTSNIEQQLIGNQTGLTIQYFDSNNNQLPSPLPTLFQNTEPFSQTINIRVEDASNPICYSETSFDLIVNELPDINLEEEYYICHLEPSISLNISSGFHSYDWFYQDGTLISNTNNAAIEKEGSYTLTVTQINNGITCENSFEFTLFRSALPEIQHVNFGELGNNYIEIIASGDGDFEYSIDGINYQDNNYFLNIQGGTYPVFVRDKDGCGQDSDEVTVIDYPKFFTPNNDGYNDFWQIRGIANLPNSKTLIFDRFGKLLTILSPNDVGWNGLYNGKQMMSNDYWFKTDLGNGHTFSGHFSLKR